ncbi:uncharacterized protein BT62DRAFT_1010978 [Guyanagaster necrorhizus]|uniref:Secreted protein n=1 Tax=Guyanagaster necrorhizus TaxID=856835 RepID=A0A9P7VK28_9AGAR|nr:uncharacterized protein BT62DRAFT_1010978 [Guyanagaster necrorhizus MCA 3950]KAG7441942.1 hypothetical protein BT62DRAFT_1010978 [Guyanagaster necrorhizus MCA 3950]
MDTSHCQCDHLCVALLTVCCELCTGGCLDFASLRHDFMENLCTCTSPSMRESADSVDEREPLLSSDRQPSPHPPMRTSGDQ